MNPPDDVRALAEAVVDHQVQRLAVPGNEYSPEDRDEVVGWTRDALATALPAYHASIGGGGLDAAAEAALDAALPGLNAADGVEDLRRSIRAALAPHRPTEPTLADLRERLEVANLERVAAELAEATRIDLCDDEVRIITRAVLAELGRAHTEGDHD